MSAQPDSVISLCSPGVHVAFCLDASSSAVLTVVRADERLQSWWAGRETLNAAQARYTAAGLSPCEVPAVLQEVIDRRWPEVVHLRSDFA